ncbi:MAG: hypothetical protein H7A55_06360 [Verrucomicrobiaceae bacterium]|nr:hypothetical protein [Verrucomicrobiaceae bacterium]
MKSKSENVNLSGSEIDHSPRIELPTASSDAELIRRALAKICYFCLYPLTVFAAVFDSLCVISTAKAMYSRCPTGQLEMRIFVLFVCPTVAVSAGLFYFFARKAEYSVTMARILSTGAVVISAHTCWLVFGGISWLAKTFGH